MSGVDPCAACRKSRSCPPRHRMPHPECLEGRPRRAGYLRRRHPLVHLAEHAAVAACGLVAGRTRPDLPPQLSTRWARCSLLAGRTAAAPPAQAIITALVLVGIATMVDAAPVLARAADATIHAAGIGGLVLPLRPRRACAWATKLSTHILKQPLGRWLSACAGVTSSGSEAAAGAASASWSSSTRRRGTRQRSESSCSRTALRRASAVLLSVNAFRCSRSASGQASFGR